MHRILKKYFIRCVIIMLVASAGFAATKNADVVEPNSQQMRKWGAGINNLPWENPEASIWWWKNDSTGNMLKFGLYSAPIYSESDSYSDALLYGSVAYYHLWRRDSFYPMLKILHGWGFGGYLRARYPQTNHEDWYTWLSVQLPLGVEHQPFQSVPFFKYSIMIDFTGRLTYKYIEYQNRANEVALNFSLTSQAQFWLVWYFH